MQYVMLGEVIQSAKSDRCGNDDYPVLSITKGEGIILQSNKFKKRIASQDTSQYKVVCRGQLVQGIHIDEANFGIQDIVDVGIVSPAYKVWNVDSSIINPKYLEEVLRSPRSIQYYASNFNGSIKRRERLSDKDFLAMKIPCPLMEEQEHVLLVIQLLRNIILARKQEISKMDELIKARFVEMFGNPVVNEKCWKSERLGNLATKIGSGATPKGGKESYGTVGISLIRSMNVHNGRFEFKELAHISDEQAAKLDNVIVEGKDVLLNITGASVARCCIVPEEILPARVNQHVCIIRCRDYIQPLFLNNLLIDDNYQDLLWNIAGSGATREAITKQQVENLQIIMPPEDLQTEFVAFVAQVDKSKAQVQKSLDETQLLFDSLMQEYFG